MNIFLLIIFIIIFILLIILMIYHNLNDKFSESIIRLDEAEIRIDNNLKDKYDNLNKVINLVKKEIKLDKDSFNDILKLRIKKNNNFNLDKDLSKIYDEFIKIYNSNEELKDNDEIYKIKKELEIINQELVILKEYYQGNLVNYNNLIKKFPTKIIAKIKKYQKRLSFDEEIEIDL